MISLKKEERRKKKETKKKKLKKGGYSILAKCVSKIYIYISILKKKQRKKGGGNIIVNEGGTKIKKIIKNREFILYIFKKTRLIHANKYAKNRIESLVEPIDDYLS